MQGLGFVQQAVGMGQHQRTLRRQALVLAAAPHDGHFEMRLQRPDRVGQRRLGDVASLRSTAKVAVLLQRHLVAQGFQQVHACSLGAGSSEAGQCGWPDLARPGPTWPISNEYHFDSINQTTQC